jgi:hypothetical protein
MWVKLIFTSFLIASVSSKAIRDLDFDFDSALCENRLSAFLVTDNADVSASPARVISNVTEEECMEICSSNRDGDGRLVICASFTYDHVKFKCSIYKRKSGPDGDLDKETTPGKRFFEKFCLDEDSPKQCAGAQFVRIDDSILSGYAKNTSIHSTMAGCINQCLKEEFICKSAMYFYDEGECITNVESGQTSPEDFGSPDDGDKVVYFSNGCIQSESAKNDKLSTAENEKDIKTEKTTDQEEKLVEEEKTDKPVTEEETTTVEVITETQTSEAELTTPSVEKESEIEKEITNEDDKEKEIKDFDNRLYGAKQLTRSENGTITIDEEALEKALEEAEKQNANKKEEETNSEIVNASKEADIKEVEAKEPPPKSEEKAVEKSIEKAEAVEKEIVSKKEEKKTESPVFQIDRDTESVEVTTSSNVEDENVKKETESPPPNLLKQNPFKAASTKHLQIQKLINASPEQPEELPKEEDSYFSKWSDWTECTQPGQRKIRRRKCLDLRRCKGALMQVDWCPKVLPKVVEDSETDKTEDGPIGPTRNPLPVAADSSEGSPPGILPPQLPNKVLKPLPEGAPGHPEDVWSPWLGVCQQFASNQPCKNKEVIGFESRECIAKNPKACKGPFFRYCTLPC